jgi:hypothetical protein
MPAAFFALLLLVPQAAPDTVVVCPEEFRAALAPWLAYRTQQGHTVALIGNLRSPEGIRQQIREIAQLRALHYVVLVGTAKAALCNDQATRSLCVPTHYAPAKVDVLWGSESHIASDNYYADLDDDQLPDLAIGRLSAASPAELAVIVEKTIAYEQSTDFGPWRRQLSLVAGLGGFGMLSDMIVESTARYFITQGIPESYSLAMAYASWRSPYCPDPRQFRETTVESLNEGAWLWVYIGHGNHLELDQVRVPGGDFPILTADDVPQLQCRHGAAVALFLSCYAGAFDATEDCLAQRMLRAPGGPVAVLAGSRVTMPYGMAVMANELMAQCFRQHPATLGDAILQAKRKMVGEPCADDTRRATLDALAAVFSPSKEQLAAERAEHVLLFNLLGDPLLRLRYPREVALAVGDGAAGAPLSVQGVSPVDGPCRVELMVPRGTLTFPAPRRIDYPRDDESLKQFQDVYQRANDGRLTVTETVVRGGRFQTDLNVPPQARGRCFVRVFVSGRADCAAGVAAVEIKEKG